VVLKRLEDALAQGDHIHAVILGSAMSNDGSEKVGFVAPSVDGQAEAIIEAMAVADVDAESIDYVETHGAGTRLGDPIEIRALTKAYRTSTDRTGFCAVGGVKTNIGHLTGAAGVAGFIKTVLSLENKQIPPTLGFLTPNPECFFEQSPFVPNTECRPWTGNGKPRRAGVSSFGLGGTNAHLILQEGPAVDMMPRPSRSWQLVTLSAKTEPALAAATTNLTAFLQANPGIDFADAAYTLKVGRQGMRYRRFVVCRDSETAVSQLLNTPVQSVPVQAKRVCFFLSGAAAWQANEPSLSAEPVFAAAVADCAAVWQRLRGVDLRTLWAQASVESDVTLPLHFTRQYALAQLWLSWSVTPQALLGVGVGELVAACLAGTLSLADALSVIAVAETAVNGSLSAHLRTLSFEEPTIPIVSAKTGTWLTHEQAMTPDFYADLLTQTKGAEAAATINQNDHYLLLTLGHAVDDVADQYSSLGADEAHLLHTIGSLWQAGVDIDWHGFYAAEERRRVVLPTYPFQRQRYWIEPDDTPAASESAAKLVKEPDLTNWFYAPVWQSETAVSPLSANDLTVGDHWLILVDTLGIAERMAAWLRQADQTVTLVYAGSDFSEGENRFTIDPLNPAHYQSLLAAVDAPQRVLHLWQLTPQLLPSDVNAFEQNIGLSYYSLLFLAQALGQEPTQIDVVANHVHQVLESEPISPEKAALLGACRVIPQEYLHLSCRLLDVAAPQLTERWVTQVLGVLQAAPST
ncbi:MAG: type I polyketide synthase, partial [Anaerolineales bacterium]|nr:type I polyketide synthase [Anaerolineales bacterium]